MTAPVSVVIPTLDVGAAIAPCLAALAEGAIDGLVAEVIFADGGSSDATAEIAEAVGARLVTAPRGRGRQLAAGAAAARAPWLLFVHADTRLAAGWPAAVRAHVARHPERAAYGRLRFESTAAMARVTEAWAAVRSRALALPYGDQGLLVSRALYEVAGGYPDLPLMEDVALVRRIGRRRLAPLATVATTSAARYEREGWLRRGALNLSTLALWYAGARPDWLSRRYHRTRNDRAGLPPGKAPD